MPQGLAEALDLPVAPLRKGQPEPGGLGRVPEEPHLTRLGQAVGQHDTPLPPRQVAARHAPLNLDFVHSLHLEARVEQALGQRAVVGEEEQPLGVEVEPPHRKEPGALVLHEVEHDRATARIAPGGEIPAGLIQQDVALGLRGRNGAAIHEDDVALRIGGGALGRHRLAVDGDAPFGDQPLTRPA
ncbi:MAG: hypothetical protein A3I03_12705 [Candidatus Rokubacteria bacterium RIFCSPLOWO2_02_FULL_68_19]|nr:MAG: hypothetical protein A3I03_12705 [Candidatus Rokubacteria bacterium RIFCSPLOWO2_02_FULL_68_19]